MKLEKNNSGGRGESQNNNVSTRYKKNLPEKK